ncbi:MAG: hypothetical protein CV087_10685 [Candidatus Brocadia sp. WS118]|nr:MAG: hypothetical protein CV087_10685 [Candidatus Brocadia sp. WS118]
MKRSFQLVKSYGESSAGFRKTLIEQTKRFFRQSLGSYYKGRYAFRLSGSAIYDSMTRRSDVDIVLLTSVRVNHNELYDKALTFFQNDLKYPGVDLVVVVYDPEYNKWTFPSDIIDEAICVFSISIGGYEELNVKFDNYIDSKEYLCSFGSRYAILSAISSYHMLCNKSSSYKTRFGGLRTQVQVINMCKILSRLGSKKYAKLAEEMLSRHQSILTRFENEYVLSQIDTDQNIVMFIRVFTALIKKLYGKDISDWAEAFFNLAYSPLKHKIPNCLMDIRYLTSNELGRHLTIEVSDLNICQLYGLALNEYSDPKLLRKIYFFFHQWSHRNIRDQIIKNKNAPADILLDAAHSSSQFTSKRAKARLEAFDDDLTIAVIDHYFSKNGIIRKRDEVYKVRDPLVPNVVFFAPYATVHHLGLVHETVDVLILNPKRTHILLYPHDAPGSQELMTLPGGHVTIIDTLKDENGSQN